FLESYPDFLRFLGIGNFDLLFTLAEEPGIKSRRLAEVSVDCPVFLLFEGLNFALAVNNQPQRNGLHAPGRESAANFVPQQGRDLISHKAVEHAPCLLRVDKIAVDIARMLESFLHSPLGDLVESYTSDALAFFIILIFFLLLLFTRTVAKFFRKMRG